MENLQYIIVRVRALVGFAAIFSTISLPSDSYSESTVDERLTSVKAEWHAATAFDKRPEGLEIDVIVLHATERRFLWQVIEYFGRPTAKASAHFTLDRNGTVVQHVRLSDRAWHAGESEMPDGRTSVNDFSIGIELVNLNDGKDPYPLPQRNALRALIRDLKEKLPIRFVVTHAAIAKPPGRKSDPRGFDPAWLEP